MSKSKIAAFMRRFAKDESGISAVEYGLLAAGIAIGLWEFVGPGGIGGSLQAVFGGVNEGLSTAVPDAG